ncbi:MAG: hypothetical protein ACXVEE_21000, partial [Polyangiales bacterium]
MKAHQDVLDLKASVARLAALDGAVVRLAEGAFLVDVAGLSHGSKRLAGHRVRSVGPDLRPLIEETHRLGVPTLATFGKAIESPRPPSLVDARMLSTLRRDLRRVASKSARAEIAREPRAFRRYPEIDDRFVFDREKKLDALGAVRNEEAPAPGLSGVLALIASIRGERAARRAREIVEAIERDARSAHPIAIARLESLRSLPEDDELARSLRNVARLPGRARARRVAKILALAVSRPVPVIPADQAFESQVELAIDALVRSFDSALPSDFDARVERCVGAYALLVRGAEREPAHSISVADVLAAEQRLAMLGAELEGRALDPAEAIALAVPSISPPQTRKLAAWLEGGLALDDVRAVVAAEALDSLLQVEGDARVASAWASWVSKLVPHFRALGLKVSLDPGVLRGVRASQEELAVLAQCLIEHDATESPVSASLRSPIESQLAALDATLALFVRAPLRVRDAIRAVRETASGEGRARFPEFAAFVDDDGRVDRFLHLARLAGESPAPSEALIEDAQLLTELARQLAHLEAMEPKADVHRARIETLKASIAAVPPSPDRTRRRLDARIRALLPRAYRVVLERILGEVLREAWGISPRKTSPAWRDAVRFFLTIEDNREHLRTLLRHAANAPGAPIERTLPKNRAYIEEMRGKIDVDAFLAARKVELVLDGARYAVQLEEDPIEVLLMGIPFDTCLSLTDGCNSASTVLNAIDANKRVLYVRDGEGAIVARKLLAISEDGRLLGYRLYCAVPKIHSALEIEVDSFCRAFAATCRLELADSGEPRKIHEGFWYDDGALPWPALAPGSDVARYCEHLGRPVPAMAPTRLCDEARRFAARESGDIERMIRALPGWLEGPGDALLGDEVVAKLGIEKAVVRAKRVDDLCAPIARALAKGTLSELALRATRYGAAEIADLNEALASAVSRYDDDPSAIGPLISLARAAIRAGLRRGLAHDAFDLERHFARAEVRTFFDEADRLEKVWAHVVAEEPKCAACREDAMENLRRVIEQAYARAPDPDAVVATLRSARAGDVSRALAIRIAARFPLDSDAPFGPFSALARGTCRVPTVVSALSKLHRSERAFAGDPDLVAAVLRQGGPTGAAKVPVPRASPFEALRDLVFDPSIDALVEPFLHPNEFRPGRFELHVHRRVDGAFRQSLRRRAIDGDGVAASWLALLGEVAAVERAGAANAGHVAIRQRLPMARAILAARTRGGLDLHERVVTASDAWPENAIDPTVVRSALALLARGETQLDAAIGTLRATKDPAWFDAVLSIAHVDEPWARAQVSAFVSGRVSATSRAIDAVAWREAFLLSQKGWASEVASALARGHFAPFDVAADRALATWTALGGAEEAQALFRRLLGALADGSPAHAMSMEDPARRDLLLDVLLERDASQRRAAFVALDDFETLSHLLDRVGVEAAAGLETSGKGPVLRSWLDAATQVTQE